MSAQDEVVTDFEFGLLQVHQAFERFTIQLSRLAGKHNLAFNEVVILHVVRMQERAKDGATIAKLLNRDDLPNVLYTLRKLVSTGLVEKSTSRSGTYFAVTPLGRIETDRYARLRRELLSANIDQIENLHEKLAAASHALQLMAGMYDSGARTASTLNPQMMFDNDS